MAFIFLSFHVLTSGTSRTAIHIFVKVQSRREEESGAGDGIAALPYYPVQERFGA